MTFICSEQFGESGYAGPTQVAARKLIKRAKAYKRASVSAKALMAISTAASPDVSKETVDAIFNKSRSMPHFASNLMMHLFDAAELANAGYVFKWPRGTTKCLNGETSSWKGKGLDETRIRTIRRLVQEKTGSWPHTWATCVRAMNQKLSYIRQRSERKRN